MKTCRSKNELILSCRIVDCPVNVLIRFDESIGSEVVVETCLRHTHVLPCSQRLFSDADEKDQHDELDAKKADLVLDALRELSVLKNRGGKGVRYRFASDQDRAQAQAALKRDLLMVMKGEEVAQLWDRARLLGHLVGIEGARRLAAVSSHEDNVPLVVADVLHRDRLPMAASLAASRRQPPLSLGALLLRRLQLPVLDISLRLRLLLTQPLSLRIAPSPLSVPTPTSSRTGLARKTSRCSRLAEKDFNGSAAPESSSNVPSSSLSSEETATASTSSTLASRTPIA